MMAKVKFFDKEEVKKKVSCLDIARLLNLNINNDRCKATWRGGDNPSAVFIDKNSWHDYKTGEGGDCFSLYMKVKNCDFHTAIDEIGRHFAIEPTITLKEFEKKQNEIEKEYIYTDEHLNAVHKTIRYKPKDFKQFDLINNEWGLKKLTKLYPYNLPNIINEKLILINEGEKACEASMTLHLASTCFAGGCGGWQDYYSEYFKNKDVIIIQDNDAAGEKFAKTITGSLITTASSVKIIILSDKPKYDCYDFVKDGGTLQQLLQLAEKTEAITQIDKRAFTSSENGKSGGSKFIPVQNLAEEFIQERYIKKRQLYLRHYNSRYYSYNNRYYVEKNSDEVLKEVTGFVRKKYTCDFRIGGSLIKDIELNIKATDLAGITDVPTIPFWIQSKKAITNTIICNNGILDINQCIENYAQNKEFDYNILERHTSDLFSLFGVDYDFIPEATCPKWGKYLLEVQPDENNRLMLQMMFGLMLIPETKYNVAFLLYGGGGTGKSVCMYVLHHFIGKNNVCCVPLGNFGNKFSLHPLTTKLVNLVGELPTSSENVKIGDMEGIFKDVTDGGLIPIEQKNKDPLSARAIARCIFAGNDLPHFADKTDGVWDRLRIIPFNVRMRQSTSENPNLKYELVSEELPGILNWAIQGLSKLLILNRFPDNSLGKTILEKHREDCDHEGVFLKEHYVFDKESKIKTLDVYNNYRSWMLTNGYKGVLGHAKFNKSVEKNFIKAETKRTILDSELCTVWLNLREKYPYEF